ncbi:hypothetical protein GCM10008094_09690 [Aidingimonas halophila]|nr:hypothetical protein GCM10008094_09690 [Aidingimonas halophila]
MEQEAAHELFASEHEPFGSITVAIILDAQGDLAVVHGKDAGIADGDPVGTLPPLPGHVAMNGCHPCGSPCYVLVILTIFSGL